MEYSLQEVACPRCDQTLSIQSRFCRHCGLSIHGSDPVAGQNRTVTLLIIFYVLELIICGLVTFNESFKGFQALCIADTIMAVVAIFFFTLIWKDVKGLLSWQNFSIKKALVYVGITILFSTVVQLSVSWLNKSLFNDEFYYYFAFARFKYPLVLMISVIALMPAIFEELAYRGFLMGGLLKLLDARQAIFISSFLFALIHLSLISFFWLLPFALFLAYIRQKENTIWYGVLVHFVFNTLTCLIEYYSLFAS